MLNSLLNTMEKLVKTQVKYFQSDFYQYDIPLIKESYNNDIEGIFALRESGTNLFLESFEKTTIENFALKLAENPYSLQAIQEYFETQRENTLIFTLTNNQIFYRIFPSTITKITKEAAAEQINTYYKKLQNLAPLLSEKINNSFHSAELFKLQEDISRAKAQSASREEYHDFFNESLAPRVKVLEDVINRFFHGNLLQKKSIPDSNHNNQINNFVSDNSSRSMQNLG